MLTGVNAPTPTTAAAPKRLSGIEALRGLAAVAVVAYHVSRHLNKAFGAPALAALFGPGQAGVDMFFVLSGFIILHVHRKDVGRPGRLTNYLSRRFTRVLPLYWVALALTVCMSAAGSGGVPGAGRLVFSAFLLPSHQEPLLGVAWTLQFEMLFYAAFALLILNRLAGLLVLSAWFACIVCSACGAAWDVLPPQVTAIYGLEFFVGMATAQLLHAGQTKYPGSVVGVGVAAFAVALLIAARGTGESGLAARLLYTVSGSAVIFGLASMDQAGTSVVPRWALTAGSASYAIYLFQFVFIGMVWQLVRQSGLEHRVPSVALFLVLTGSAVTGGVLTSWWVEKPMLKLWRR